MSSRVNGESSEGGLPVKKMSDSEFFDLMLQETSDPQFPGAQSLYLYSGNYQTVEKLVQKTGRSLQMTENEYWEEMKQFLPEGQLNPTTKNTNNIGGSFFMSNIDNEFAQG